MRSLGLRIAPWALMTSFLGCGPDDVPPKVEPSAIQVRDLLGINTESCIRYTLALGTGRGFATIGYTGPNTTSIINETVYLRNYSRDSGGSPEEWFLDTESAPAVHLLRSTEGQNRPTATPPEVRISRRYETEPTPLFGQAIFDDDDKVALEVGARFETDVTPSVCEGSGACMPGMVEKHTWLVLSKDQMVTTPDGPLPAYDLEYRLQIGAAAPKVARYSLVPGKGVAKFTDFAGVIHQSCAWRTCDSTGTCTGKASCQSADLTCQ